MYLLNVHNLCRVHIQYNIIKGNTKVHLSSSYQQLWCLTKQYYVTGMSGWVSWFHWVIATRNQYTEAISELRHWNSESIVSIITQLQDQFLFCLPILLNDTSFSAVLDLPSILLSFYSKKHLHLNRQFMIVWNCSSIMCMDLYYYYFLNIFLEDCN